MSFGLKLFAFAAALIASAGAAAADDLKIALIYGRTGPLQAYAKQTETGLELGFEYATKGTMEVDGRKIVIIAKDDQGKPDLAKSALAEAYEDDGADIAVGTTSSAAAIAMLPVAEEHKKILVVEPAVADEITGSKWNRYIFRTARNSSQDAISNAVAIGKPGVHIATLAQDYAFGRDGVAAFKEALAKTGATVDAEEYAPINTTDFTAPAQRLFDALKDKPGRKIIWIDLGGRGRSARQARRSRPGPLRHRTLDRRQHLARACRLQALPRPRGSDVLLLRHPQESDQRLAGRRTSEALQRPAGTSSPPGALRRRWRSSLRSRRRNPTDAEKLIAAMEGMDFDTPKGKMTFRKEDHQALQSMYAFKIKVDPKVAWGIPELARELKIDGHGYPDPQQAMTRLFRHPRESGGPEDRFLGG